MPQQLDPVENVSIARARGHAAAQRAADKAERVVVPDWTACAVEAIRVFARNQPALFTLEIARGVIELQGAVPKPCDLRAWGVAAQVAARRGFIERTSTYHPAVSSNGSPKPCYRRGPKA